MEKIKCSYVVPGFNNIKSVKSINPCKSVIQTSYDIVKAHGGEIKVETNEGEGLPAGQAGSEFIITFPIV